MSEKPIQVSQNADDLMSSARHILGTIGGILAGKGYIQDAEIEMYVGLAMALGSIGLSWYNSRQKNKKIEQALYTPPPKP